MAGKVFATTRLAQGVERLDPCLQVFATFLGGVAAIASLFSLNSLKWEFILIGVLGFLTALVSSLAISRALARKIDLPAIGREAPTLARVVGLLLILMMMFLLGFLLFQNLPAQTDPTAGLSFGHRLHSWAAGK